MIHECPRCGGAIPADTRPQYEDDECPRCRFVVTTTAIADGGREVSDR